MTAWFHNLGPRAQVLIAMAVLISLAMTSRFWQPLLPDYHWGLLIGFSSGWQLRGIRERQRHVFERGRS